MLKSTNKHVGIFSFIGNNILMFIFTLAFGALITSRGIDLSAVTPAKIFFLRNVHRPGVCRIQCVRLSQ